MVTGTAAVMMSPVLLPSAGAATGGAAPAAPARSAAAQASPSTTGVATRETSTPGRSPSPAASPAATACRAVDNSSVVPRRLQGRDDLFAHQAWLATAAAQRRVASLATDLTARFGRSSKADPVADLRRGLVGTAVDHRRQRIVVVVAKGSGSAATRTYLARRSQTAGASTTTRGSARVAVVEGCRTATQLLRASEVLAQRSWTPAARAATISFHLDPADSTYHVTVASKDAAVAPALRSALGALVSVQVGRVGRTDRLNDGEPHYGGAAIGFRNDRFCSSGFTIIRSNGARAGTTASHCFSTNGINVYSGTKFWGVTGGRRDYPRFDVMWVSRSDQSYDNVIHTDPCCPDTRTVTSASDPSVGNLVCASGFVSKAVCGLEVIGTNSRLCDEDGCTTSLFRAYKSGTVGSRGGDSGGPVYIRVGSGSAAIKGSIVGVDSTGALLGEKVSGVLDHLDARIATS